MTEEDELEEVMDNLSVELKKNIKARKRLNTELVETIQSHRKNGKSISDTYVQYKRND